MKVLIVNQPGLNRGDDSAHRGLVRSLLGSLPDGWTVEVAGEVDFSKMRVRDDRVHYQTWSYTKSFRRLTKYCQSYDWPLWLTYANPTVREIRSILRESDAVICAPGGICLGGFTNWTHLLLLRLAQRMDKPTYYFGRSIGPFSEARPDLATFKRRAFEMLGRCHYLSLRDQVSCGIAEAAGLHPCHTTDSAFLDDPQAELPDRRLAERPYVVFVPQTLTWHNTFRASDPAQIERFYTLTLRHLLERLPDHDVVMLPQTYTKDTGESDYMSRLSAAADATRVWVAPRTWSSDQQQRVVRGADLVVGARYHSIVFALNQGRPFVSLSYEHKMSGLLQTLGLTDMMVDLTVGFSDPDALAERANALIDANLGRDMGAARQRAKTIAREAFDKMIEQLKREI